jgi:dethiobiotin synthetase
MNATRGIFVTGTDTGVGKTIVAVALLRALVASGRRAVGMKPISAGFEPDSSVNADVVALDGAGNVDAPVADRNPFAFAPAIAPHLAAVQAEEPAQPFWADEQARNLASDRGGRRRWRGSRRRHARHAGHRGKLRICP